MILHQYASTLFISKCNARTRFTVLYQLKWQSAFLHSAILTAVMFVIFSKMTFFTIIYIFIYFFKRKPKFSGQQGHAALLLVFIPLTSVFVMVTLLTVNKLC